MGAASVSKINRSKLKKNNIYIIYLIHVQSGGYYFVENLFLA